MNGGVGSVTNLGVKHSVGVVPVSRPLVQPVVAAARVVHVHVPKAQGEDRRQASEAQNGVHLSPLGERDK